MNKDDKSKLILIKSTSNGLDDLFSYNIANNISKNEKVFLILGGVKTDTEEKANRYPNFLKSFIGSENLQETNIYSAFYESREQDLDTDKVNLFAAKLNHVYKKSNKKLGSKKLNQIPNMIYDLFNILILPRITDESGKKIDTKIAEQQLSKITVFGHCYGNIIMEYLDILTVQKMTELNYTKSEINKIQQNLLTIIMSPIGPLGRSGFQVYSFLSATDYIFDSGSPLSNFMYKNNELIKPLFFEGRMGNLFVVSKLTKQESDEHSIRFMNDTELLTDDGKIIYEILKNVLVNGILRNGKKTLEELAGNVSIGIKQLKEEGNKFIPENKAEIVNDFLYDKIESAEYSGDKKRLKKLTEILDKRTNSSEQIPIPGHQK